MKKSYIILTLFTFLISNLTNTPARASSSPLLGEIMLFAGNYCPRGWAPTDGQLMPINRYSALFSIMGTQYGGDGRSTFALPDLRGRVAIGEGKGSGLTMKRVGQKGGVESVTLTSAQIPSHNHSYSFIVKEGRGVKSDATNSSLAESGIFRDSGRTKTLSSQTTNNTGGNQAHTNMQPYLVLKSCIAIQGIFPSRN